MTDQKSKETEKSLSVIVVSWNTRELLDRCLTSLQAEISNMEHQVFVVDNASSDGSADMVAEKHHWVRLIRNDSNLGFAMANNQAFWLASGDYVLLLNPDTEVKEGAIKKLLSFIESKPKAGVVAPQLLNTDGSIQRSCREFPTFAGMLYELCGLSRVFPENETFGRYKMLSWNHDDERQVDQPEGACLLIRREALEQVGLFDEGFFMLFEEVDWCYRLKKAGWEIWFTPESKITHHYGQSIKQVKSSMILSSHRGLYRFWRKHYRGSRWYMDPLAYCGLMGLAYLRVMSHEFNELMSAPEPAAEANAS